MVHPSTLQIRLNYFYSLRDYYKNGGLKNAGRILLNGVSYFFLDSRDMGMNIECSRSPDEIETIIQETEKNLAYLQANRGRAGWRALQREYLDTKL